MELAVYHPPEEETINLDISEKPKLALRRDNGNKIEFYKLPAKKITSILKKRTAKLESEPIPG